MDRTYSTSPNLWDIIWERLGWHPIVTQRHGTVYPHLTLSISRRLSIICTTTPGNLQHWIITSVWVATKHYIQYIGWTPVPPIQVWTPLFQAPQAHGKVGHHPPKVLKVLHPLMCSMHVYQVYSQTMAWALQKDPTQAFSSRLPWADSLCGPAGITNSRASCKDDWPPRHQKI